MVATITVTKCKLTCWFYSLTTQKLNRRDYFPMLCKVVAKLMHDNVGKMSWQVVIRVGGDNHGWSWAKTFWQISQRLSKLVELNCKVSGGTVLSRAVWQTDGRLMNGRVIITLQWFIGGSHRVQSCTTVLSISTKNIITVFILDLLSIGRLNLNKELHPNLVCALSPITALVLFTQGNTSNNSTRLVEWVHYDTGTSSLNISLVSILFHMCALCASVKLIPASYRQLQWCWLVVCRSPDTLAWCIVMIIIII